uniref:Uncharacterized protein n=1 Tax=Arcella intermedia TaxID=1963864 RepID=A0A6B2LW88_9EUKA
MEMMELMLFPTHFISMILSKIFIWITIKSKMMDLDLY